MKNKKLQIILKTALPWVALLLAVGVGGGWFVFSKLDEEETKLDEVIQNYSDTEIQLKSFEEIKKDYDTYKGDREKLQNMVVSKNNTLNLIQELEEGAKVAGVQLKTSVGEKPLSKKNPGAKTTESSTPGKEEPLWLKAELIGNFDNVVKFIKYIENGSFLVSITNLTLSQSKKSTPENMLENKDGSLGIVNATLLITNEF